jgi:hypothetical protein
MTRSTLPLCFNLVPAYKVIVASGLAVLLQISAAQAASIHTIGQLQVTIKPLPGPDGKVATLEVCELLTDGAPEDSAPLRFSAPISVIGIEAVAASVTDLTVADSSGPVGLTQADDAGSASDGELYHHWQADRAVGSSVTIRYRVATQPIADRGPPYGMKPAGEGVAGSGISFLVLPENSTSATTTLAWDISALPPGSLGVVSDGPDGVTIPGPPSKVRDEWMLAGPAISYSSNTADPFHAYLLGDPPFDREAILRWSGQAYHALAASLRYLGTPKYALLFRTLDGPSFGTGTARSEGGSALINLGTAFYPGQTLAGIENTIFHEMTHQWTGHLAGDPSWFSEGLTVYRAAALPCRAQLMSTADCAAWGINVWAQRYYGSQGRNWSQAKIHEVNFGDETIRTVPYGRGMLYFALLNSEILTKSDGRRDLEDALYPLFIAMRNGQQPDQASFEAILVHELGDEAVTAFHEMVIDGTTTVVPPSDAFGPCLERVTVKLQPKGSERPVDGYEWRPRHCQ